MLLTSLFFLWLNPAAPQDIPPYFVKFVQDRTLFASDEPVWVTVRLGNQSPRDLRSRKFPDILKSLKLMRDDEELKMSDQFSSALFYKKLKSLKYGAHRDFRLNLRRYFPEMQPGAVYRLSYHDSNYDLQAKPISLTDIKLPDLNREIVLETTLGNITIQLSPEEAPNHSSNFAILTAMSFYQDMIFHRVVPGYVIQTGDPIGNGTGGSSFQLALEKSPFLKHQKYAVGMARGDAEDSATSQFYICLEPQKELNDSYTVFGKVTAGFDVVDAIGRVPTTGSGGNPRDKPLTDVALTSVKFKD